MIICFSHFCPMSLWTFPYCIYGFYGSDKSKHQKKKSSHIYTIPILLVLAHSGLKSFLPNVSHLFVWHCYLQRICQSFIHVIYQFFFGLSILFWRQKKIFTLYFDSKASFAKWKEIQENQFVGEKYVGTLKMNIVTDQIIMSEKFLDFFYSA